jgi:hypothetical protein
MADLNEKDPLTALIAIDIGFSLLLENLKNHSPVIAKSLAIDMLATAQEVPARLPPTAQGVADVLSKWSAVLNSDPTSPAHDQPN